MLFNTAVPFNVTELVGRKMRFVNYENMERYTWIELANMHGAGFTSGRAAQRL